MEEKSKSSQRRYQSIRHLPTDEQQTFSNDDFQRLIRDPLSSTAAAISPKRRRSSITANSISQTSPEQDLIYHRTIPSEMNTRKRSAQDDIAAYPSHPLFRDPDHHSNKRARYEHSRSIELENQPPRSSVNAQQHSLFLHHHPELNRLASTWTNLPIQHEIPLFFPNILPSITRTTTNTSSSASANIPYHEHDPLSNHYSPLLTEHYHHSSSIFADQPLRISGQKSTNSKSQMRFLSPQSNGNCPLRTTNFLLDNKQQQASSNVRSGNISPAHSDSSSESTSTCSSDEQSHHQFSAFRSQHQHLLAQAQQPWRTYRERENYEQLLDLAEKLSDPNRFKQVDIHQFISYRYKSNPLTSDALLKQTACVICMSHFKNGQHIRVLPCQHEYHSKCIARWFTMNSSCPICRRDNFL